MWQVNDVFTLTQEMKDFLENALNVVLPEVGTQMIVTAEDDNGYVIEIFQQVD